MKHFSEQVWADFVRGIGHAPTNREIEAHISNGCPDCVGTVGMWKQMYSIAINEPRLTPPDNAVRMVKLEFAARQSQQAAPWVLGRLVFDSLTQPLPAGIRSGVSDSRQLVFDADGTIVDLVLNAKPQSTTVSLVGQVVDKRKTKSPTPPQVAITLWTESEQPLAAASANEYGEFQMEFAAQERLRLSIEIAGQKPIRIPAVNLNPTVTHGSITAVRPSHRYEN